MSRYTKLFNISFNPAKLHIAKWNNLVAKLAKDLSNLITANNASRVYFHSFSLDEARITTNMDVGNIAAVGGLGASDSDPILEAVNAATKGQQRLNWAANSVVQIMLNVNLPPDFDPTEDLEIHLKGLMSGSTATTTSMVSAVYFDEEDAVADLGAADFTDAVSEVIITIAAADIPADSQNLSIGLTPEAHATDALYVTGIWLEGTLT